MTDPVAVNILEWVIHLMPIANFLVLCVVLGGLLTIRAHQRRPNRAEKIECERKQKET